VNILKTLVLAGLCWSLAGAEPGPQRPNWLERLRAVPGGPAVQASFVVWDSRGRSVEEWDADRLQVPASTLKLATAIRLLELGVLGQHLQTSLEIRAGRVRCRGDYNPELSAADLENLALQALPQLPDRIVLEVPLEDANPYPPGWAWDDLSSSFAPPIGPLVFEHGLVPLKLAREAAGLKVVGPPWAPTQGLDFLPKAGEFEMLVLPGWGHWVMAGELPAGVEEAVTVPMLHPNWAAARLLSEVWRSKGKQVEVTAVTGDTLGGPAIQCTHSSREVGEILRQGLADSDNLVMECLYRRYGRQLPKCWTNQVLRVVDGSGLSRYNLVSARQLMLLLQDQPQLSQLLPVAGQQGTLRRRFLQTPLQGQLRAKTGTMSGVSGLAGEFLGASGQRYHFALLMAGFVGKAAPFKQFEEELLLELAARS
jgi:D-alanyl-D-alanine carboxypeptidase/D-alanyl-D-alanine-endopeptidase (penicillin-binding protein 4)